MGLEKCIRTCVHHSGIIQSGFFKNFIYLFLAVLGLLCCMSFSLVVASRGYSLVEMCWLLIAVASLVAVYRIGVSRLSSCGTWT